MVQLVEIAPLKSLPNVSTLKSSGAEEVAANVSGDVVTQDTRAGSLHGHHASVLGKLQVKIDHRRNEARLKTIERSLAKLSRAYLYIKVDDEADRVELIAHAGQRGPANRRLGGLIKKTNEVLKVVNESLVAFRTFKDTTTKYQDEYGSPVLEKLIDQMETDLREVRTIADKLHHAVAQISGEHGVLQRYVAAQRSWMKNQRDPVLKGDMSVAYKALNDCIEDIFQWGSELIRASGGSKATLKAIRSARSHTVVV